MERSNGIEELFKQNANKQDYLCNVKITEQDIYLMPSLRTEIDDIVRIIKNPKAFGEDLGFHGFFFRGAPGTGKTLTAEYIATVTGSDLRYVQGFQIPAEVSEFFKIVRNAAKTKTQVVLIDDIDRLSNRQDMIDPTQAAVLNQFLIELNGVDKNNNVYCIGTSNYYDKLDNALLRYKRLGKVIDFYPPDETGRFEMLKLMSNKEVKKHNFNYDLEDLRKIASQTYGYTGDDLFGLLSQAAVYALKKETSNVSINDLILAKEKIPPTALKDMPFKDPKKRLDELIGLDLHKELILDAIGRDFNRDSDGLNFLLYGVPGTGKSSFAEAIANNYKFNYMIINGSSLVNSLVGKTGELIERLLKRAESLAPSVILLDEIHALVETSDWKGFKDNWTPRLRSRLSEGLKGVLIFATLPEYMYSKLEKETLDRFPYKLLFGNPDEEARVNLWTYYLNKNNVNPTLFNMNELSNNSEDFSPRIIEQVCSLIKRHNVTNIDTIKKLLDYFSSEDDKKEINHVELFKIIKEGKENV